MDQMRYGALDGAPSMPTPELHHRIKEVWQNNNTSATHVPTERRSTGAAASPVSLSWLPLVSAP